jgi:thiol-disulfide isomerase/thioredoxin
MKVNKILWIVLFSSALIGFWGYKTYLATPCINFDDVVIQKDGIGEKTNLSKLQGKVTLVAFFQTWCSDCIKEMPTIISLQNIIQNENLNVILVTDESISKLEKFKTRFPDFSFDYYLSIEKLPTFGIRKYPTTYLVDEKGNILKSTLEGNNWGSAKIIELVQNKLNN